MSDQLTLPVTVEEEKKPVYVHCHDCGHQWVAFWTPLTMDRAGMRLLNHACRSPCPKCASKKIFMEPKR